MDCLVEENGSGTSSAVRSALPVVFTHGRLRASLLTGPCQDPVFANHVTQAVPTVEWATLPSVSLTLPHRLLLRSNLGIFSFIHLLGFLLLCHLELQADKTF